jgi:hypothetical protein
MACAVPVVLRETGRERSRVDAIWFPGPPRRVGLAAPMLPDGARILRVAATGDDGGAVAPPEIVREDGGVWLVPSASARRLELEWTN